MCSSPAIELGAGDAEAGKPRRRPEQGHAADSASSIVCAARSSSCASCATHFLVGVDAIRQQGEGQVATWRPRGSALPVVRSAPEDRLRSVSSVGTATSVRSDVGTPSASSRPGRRAAPRTPADRPVHQRGGDLTHAGRKAASANSASQPRKDLPRGQCPQRQRHQAPASSARIAPA